MNSNREPYKTKKGRAVCWQHMRQRFADYDTFRLEEDRVLRIQHIQ